MTSVLGTQSNLTGIPTLLLSSLQNVTDSNAKAALYQVQNWANSFFTWNYGPVSAAYTTGGLAFSFPNPFGSTLMSIDITPTNESNASQTQLVSATSTGFTVKLYNPVGTEIANGDPVGFFYIAVGH